MGAKVTKAWKAVGAVALGLILVAGGITGGFFIGKDNGGTNPKGENSFVVSGGEGSGISLMSVTVPVNEYTSKGVPSTAESAQTITATITPADAANKNVVWKLNWVDGGSEWATGKAVTDYVGIAEDINTYKGSEVTVYCLQPFGEQVQITAISEQNKSFEASCTCDYVKRLADITAVLQRELETVETVTTVTIGDGAKYRVSAEPVWTDGTIKPEFTVSNEFTMDNRIIDQYLMNTYGLDISKTHNYNYEGSFTCDGEFWKNFYEKDAVTNNQFIRAVQALGSQTRHGLIQGEVTVTYNGKSYNPDNLGIDIKFKYDISNMKVDAEGISMSDSSLIF